jgi:hypothetical protein
MLIEAILLSVVVALVRGGDMKLLGQLGIKSYWLIFAPGILICLLYTKYIPGMEFVVKLGPFVHVIAYLMVLIVIYINRRLPGMALIGLGAILNFTAIAVNSGKMPVSPQAAKSAGMERLLARKNQARHSLINSNTRLKFLCDVIPLKWPPFPDPQVISLGDIGLAFGLFILVQRATCDRKRIPTEVEADT